MRRLPKAKSLPKAKGLPKSKGLPKAKGLPRARGLPRSKFSAVDEAANQAWITLVSAGKQIPSPEPKKDNAEYDMPLYSNKPYLT